MLQHDVNRDTKRAGIKTLARSELQIKTQQYFVVFENLEIETEHFGQVVCLKVTSSMFDLEMERALTLRGPGQTDPPVAPPTA